MLKREISVAIALVGLVACTSPGDRSGDGLRATPALTSPVRLGASPGSTALIVPSASWGDGRALDVVALADGASAVVTTTGVFHWAEGVAVPLDRFDQPTRLHGVAVSDDGSALAIAIGSPAVVRWYDLAATARLGEDQLDVGENVFDLAYLAGTRTLAAVTSAGVRTWATPADVGGRFPLGSGVQVGQSAALPSGIMLAPILGTAVLGAIEPDGAVEQIQLSLPDGSTVRDALASPDGSLLGVSHGEGADDFERVDSIALLDPATLSERGSVDAGRPLNPGEWTLSDDMLAIAEGRSVSFWTHDGTDLGTGRAPIDSDVATLLAGHGAVVAVHRSGVVVRWSLVEGAPAAHVLSPVLAPAVTARVTATTPEELLIVDQHGRIGTWSADRWDRSDVLDRFAAGQATSVAVSPGGESIAIGSTTGQAIVLDPDLDPIRTIAVTPDPARVDTVAFTPAEGVMVTGLAQRLGDLAFDDTITAWDLDTSTIRYQLIGDSEDVAGCAFYSNRVSFSPDGTLMAANSHDFSIALVDPADGTVIHRFDPLPTTVLDLAFSSDGTSLIVSTDDASVTVFDIETRSAIARVEAPMGGYQAFDALPDGRAIGIDVTGTLSVFDPMTGAQVATFMDSGARTTTLVVSPDGKFVAAPVADAGVGVWSASTGTQLALLRGHTDDVTGIAFGDPKTIYTSSSDGTARRWELDLG